MLSSRPGLTYQDAGVDIGAGDALVKAIKPFAKATARAGCSAELGQFGGLFDVKAAGYTDPLLVSGTDGVGTKLKVGGITFELLNLNHSGLELFWEKNINVFTFSIFIVFELAQVVEILPHERQGHGYPTFSILWLLMTWRCKEPGHQQAWYRPSLTKIKILP